MAATTVADRQESDAIVRCLLEYLLEHPGAMDTIEGIQMWWLRNRYAAAAVEAVLTRLEEEALLESHEFTPGLRVYGFREGARAQMLARLSDRKRGDQWRT